MGSGNIGFVGGDKKRSKGKFCGLVLRQIGEQKKTPVLLLEVPSGQQERIRQTKQFLPQKKVENLNGRVKKGTKRNTAAAEQDNCG